MVVRVVRIWSVVVEWEAERRIFTERESWPESLLHLCLHIFLEILHLSIEVLLLFLHLNRHPMHFVIQLSLLLFGHFMRVKNIAAVTILH